MAKIQDGTNLYSSHTIVVDSAGKTPFTTVAAGITAAVGLGVSNPTVYIRAGTYTENLTLINGVNLCGDDPYTCIIDGAHTIPAAGQIQISNLKLAATTPATSLFNETGAGTCAIDITNCIFNVNSGMVFNLTTSTGPLSITNCTDISAANSIAINTTGISAVTIRDSVIGTGAVTANFGGATTIYNSSFSCPMTFSQAGAASAYNCDFFGAIVLSDTATFGLFKGYISTGATAAITANAGTTVTLDNVVIDSSAANIVTGAGTAIYGQVTATNAFTHNVTTETYTTRTITGSVQLDETNAGVPYFTAGVMGSTAALTDGQLLVGKTGNPPSLATLTAGAGTTITNGAGSITVAQTAGFPFAFTTIAADGALATGTAYINTKAAALSVSLPAVSAQGDVIILQGGNAATTGWTITQAANQQILVGNANTTLGAGGSLASTDKGDAVSLVCTTANLEWRVFGMVGNLTVV